MINFLLIGTKKGLWFPLKDSKGISFGAAVATTDDIKNPIFVSPGHNISIETAVDWTLKCSKFRQPEPIRYADQKTRILISKSIK